MGNFKYLWLGFRGRFCPIRRPLFQGSRRGTDGWFLSSMIVSSEPTAPSRLRSGEGRRDILSPVAGFLLKPTRGSSAANGLTPFGSGPSLSDHDHDRPPPLQIQWSRLVALGADHRKLVPKFSDDAPHKEGLKPACLALAPRAGEVS